MKVHPSGLISAFGIILFMSFMFITYGWVPRYTNMMMFFCCAMPSILLSILSFGYKQTFRGIFACRILFMDCKTSVSCQDQCVLKGTIWFCYISAITQILLGTMYLLESGAAPGNEFALRVSSMIASIFVAVILAEFIFRPAWLKIKFVLRESDNGALGSSRKRRLKPALSRE